MKAGREVRAIAFYLKPYLTYAYQGKQVLASRFKKPLLNMHIAEFKIELEGSGESVHQFNEPPIPWIIAIMDCWP